MLLLTTLPVVGDRHSTARAGVPAVPGEIVFTRSVVVPGPRIADVTAAASQNDIYRVPAAAPFAPVTRVAGVSTSSSDEQQAVWSPDGRRIAFVRVDPANDQSAIWVADADGTDVRQVTLPPVFFQVFNDRDPAWSPDSRRLVFTRVSAGSDFTISDLRIVDVPASGPPAPGVSLLSDPGLWVSQPDWSPDGQRIAYRAQDRVSRSAHIASIAPDGTRGPVLTSGPNDGLPAWSPDGSRLAYVAGDSINVLTIGGGTITLAEPSGPGEFPDIPTEPAWSPDGRLVAYAWLRGGNGDIRAVAATGGVPFDVVTGSTNDREPSWRPTADLRLTVASSPAPLLFGQPGAIVATIANGGPATAPGVRVELAVPAAFNAVSVQPTGCVLTEPPGGSVGVECDLGALPSGGSAVVTLIGRPTTYGGISVSADVESGVFDADLADNVVRTRLDVTGSDLAVDVIDLGSPYVIDSPASYLLRARLNDGEPVDDAVVELRLPNNVTFVGVDAPRGVTCRHAALLLRCGLPPLDFEGRTIVAITVRATASELGEQQGTATITSSAFDPEPLNNTATVTTRVIAPKLAVAKQAPGTAVVGEEYDYDLTVRNGGEVVVVDGVLVDQIPAGLTVVAVETSTARCATAAGSVTTVTCHLPRLTPPTADDHGGTARVRVRVRPTAPGTVLNTACVRFSPGRPPPVEAQPARVFEDCDRVQTGVRAGDLAIAVTAVPATGYVGGSINATVTVTNEGDATVPAAARIELPAIACEMPTAAACAARIRDVSLGRLGPGQTTRVPVTLTAVAAGTATVLARVRPSTFDANPANNTASASVTVRQPKIAAVPPIGPPGFVTLGVGTDFPPGATVRLRWSRGISVPIEVRVGSDGTFRQQVLVFHHDALGDRRLDVTGTGFAPVDAAFTVVPGRQQPGDFVQRR